VLRLTLLILLLLAPGNAMAGWKKATSDNFVVYSDGDEAALRSFTAKVEAFDSLLRIASGVSAPPTPKRLEIVLVRNVNAVGRLLGKGGKYVAGFYSPRLSGAIAVVPRIGNRANKYDLDGETVLFHEYAHHFMKQYFPNAYPVWYVEGFAEFYSTAEVTDNGTATIGKPAYHRAYGLMLSAPFPLSRMLADDTQARNAQEVDAYYGRAWLLAHMLSFSDTRRGQLDRYLKAYAKGAGDEKAATDAFGPIPALEKELDRYLASRKMKYRQFSGLETKAAKISVEALSPAQDALFIEHLNWLLGIDKSERPGFVSRVRKIAAQFPDDATALDLRAEAERLGGDDGASSALTERILTLRPDYGPALLRKAETLAEKIKESDDRSSWKAVRSLIVKANRANPDDTTALFLYYLSFRREGIEPTKIATDGAGGATHQRQEDSRSSKRA